MIRFQDPKDPKTFETAYGAIEFSMSESSKFESFHPVEFEAPCTNHGGVRGVPCLQFDRSANAENAQNQTTLLMDVQKYPVRPTMWVGYGDRASLVWRAVFKTVVGQ